LLTCHRSQSTGIQRIHQICSENVPEINTAQLRSHPRQQNH
jgi:hypothetical protein